MNYNLVLGVFLSMVFFTIGLKYNVSPVAYGSRFGYSSKRSLATEETWIEANAYLGRLLMIFSLIFLLILVICNFLDISLHKILFGSVFFGFVSSSSIFVLIEKYLKKRFFRDGKSKPNSTF